VILLHRLNTKNPGGGQGSAIYLDANRIVSVEGCERHGPPWRGQTQPLLFRGSIIRLVGGERFEVCEPPSQVQNALGKQA
jgi:hypothetical protein